MEVCRKIGNRAGEGRALSSLGITYARQGRWAEAETFFQQSLVIRQELGDRIGEEQTLDSLALLHADQGDIAGALVFGRQAIAVLETTEDKAALEKARQLVAEWGERVKYDA